MVQLVKDYGKTIDWNVGALFAHDRFMWKLLDICKELNYEVPIKYVFGSIPCRFQGGRVAPRDADLENAYKIFDAYRDRGVGCRLTFSNVFITEDDLGDDLSNNLLDYLNTHNDTGLNGVIVASDILAKYIKEKYPTLQLISSQVKPSCETGLGDDKDTVEYYNNLFDLYDVVVVNPFKVNDVKFLNGIRYPERVEFIANHRCVPNCPRAKVHYETQMMLGNKFLSNEDYSEEEKRLAKINAECIEIKKQYPLAGNSFSQSDIEQLLRMGFTQFKIEGRDNDGVCFIRDLGDYIFNTYLYDRIASSIMEIAV